MIWWQLILVLLIGIFPCICVAAFMTCLLIDLRQNAKNYGEITSNLKGIYAVIQRVDKKIKDSSQVGE